MVKETRNWLEYPREEDDKVVVDELWSIARIGRPCGDDGFMSRIEGLLGRETKGFTPWEAS